MVQHLFDNKDVHCRCNSCGKWFEFHKKRKEKMTMWDIVDFEKNIKKLEKSKYIDLKKA